MIRLHPIPDANHTCPYCHVRLEVRGWCIPGMRNLADLRCSRCGLEFYGDLLAGHGLYYPMLIEQATGVVHDEYHVDWFANWLRDSYANRIKLPVAVVIEDFRPLKQPVLLNCLDTLYGHSLLKLLNAQYYLEHRPDLDLVVLVPRFLRWMVPEGVAAIWTVDLPLKRGSEWNTWLAAEIKQRVERSGVCWWLSVALSHPHSRDYNIERFTGVRPFPVEEWDARLEQPAVTFVWREDRTWRKVSRLKHIDRLKQRLRRKLGLSAGLLDEQKEIVVELARFLRRYFTRIDFAVVGLGCPAGLPDWIADLRTLEISEHIERSWCRRYAQSHVVVGVHGSNMLLPSAHAGAVVELVPAERWGNLIQDILMPARDGREMMYRCRFLPLDSSAVIVAEVTASLLRDFSCVLLNFNRPWCDHDALQSDPLLIVKRHREIVKRLADL